MRRNPRSAPDADSPGRAGGTDIESAERDYVFHGWSAQNSVNPITIVGAKGSYFWDQEGRAYLDFASQMVNMNIGHQHPRVVEAIQEQAAKLCMIAPHFGHEARTHAARLIAKKAPNSGSKVFFTTGGAEAVEHAVRMARQHTGRHKILAGHRSYHGATNLALHLSGEPRRWNVDNGSQGVVHFFTPYLYRSAFHATTADEECDRAIQHLADVIDLEGPGTLAAVLLEPIVGTGGILVPPHDYLAGVRELCDRHGIVMIADEVMSGFGRTGRWFAVDHWGVKPDLITFSKGVNSGYVPLGGVIVSPAIAETFTHRAYDGGLTLSGHPLACTAAGAAIGAMEDEGIIKRAAWIGEHVLGPGLQDLMERHPCVGEVRGLGVFWALELVKSRRTREMLVPYSAERGAIGAMRLFKQACVERGLWPFIRMNRVHVMPPCTIDEAEVKVGLAVLDEALGVVDAHVNDAG